MPCWIFIDPAGNEHRVEATPGQSMMEAVVAAGVPGIEAVCGGNCLCATCHCYVDRARIGELPAAVETEQVMLECTSQPAPNSRLTCQITVTGNLDGLSFEVPASQH